MPFCSINPPVCTLWVPGGVELKCPAGFIVCSHLRSVLPSLPSFRVFSTGLALRSRSWLRDLALTMRIHTNGQSSVLEAGRLCLRESQGWIIRLWSRDPVAPRSGIAPLRPMPPLDQGWGTFPISPSPPSSKDVVAPMSAARPQDAQGFEEGPPIGTCRI